MSDFDHAFAQLQHNPTPEQLEVFTSQVETLSKMLKFDQMKRKLQDCLSSILREQRFDGIRLSEHMLRLYKLLGSYSRSLGGRGVYEQLYRKAHFNESLKFYLQWAEQCAKERVLEPFKEVLQKARDSLSATMSMSSIESGFRDLVDEFFDGKQSDLFFSPDDTMDLFRDHSVLKPGRRNKRRSSVCFLRAVAPINNDKEPLFGRGTKTLIRSEFVDTPAVYGVSIEEFRLANYKDTFGEDVEHQQRRDSGIVHMKPVSDEARKARDVVDARMASNLNSRRRPLPALVEGNADEEEEKRSRFNSPVIPTRDAHRPPLRAKSEVQRTSETITLSSDTKSVKENSYNELDDSVENEKLRVMAAGRENTRPDRSSNYSTTTSSIRTAKSGGGLDLQAENNCLEAHAMFSETLHLGATEKTIPVVAATQIYTDFSVLCDPDPTMTLDRPPPPGKKTSGGLNVVFDEQAPAPEEQVEEEQVEEEEKEETKISELKPMIREKMITKLKEEDESRSTLQTPPTYSSSLDEDDVFSDELVHGFGRKTRGGIVTSTPAAGIPFIDIDSYFGNKSDENARQVEEPAPQPTFAVPQGSAFNKMLRRKSQAPPALTPAPPPPAPVLKAEPNSSIDCLSDNLGRRLSIGAEEIKALDDTAEMTGCIQRRRSEIIRKGDINPWDESLRRKLMATVRSPVNMHEFQERAAKIQANRDYEVGGETLHIQTVIGQGGYAKVYKAVNEERKTVAVKFEVPSCSWEVYICDQMRNRLIKEGDERRVKMADWCIMQVMDAYVFSTASLLVNEYHEYGNLLECMNHMKDPNWHISAFLVAQIARILKEVHDCKIIHGDVKPDNFMITRKIDSNWDREALMSSDTFVIKLIDWGRAIDMMQLKDQKFKGRAGTDGFDSPEMIDGRSWTYQADFYGFAVSMAVLCSPKYPKLTGSIGAYSLSCDIKRRNVLRDTVNEIATKLVNIPSCDELPDWNEIIAKFSDFWEENFDASAWRQAVAKFNDACDIAAANNK
ncbi:hypothetical protein GCK72_000179 [Caenorhabditis remanei]|uniref:Protein kinase domain-containing protein n=1 Tax=Caenorhabditis remanei TaxID=31234 RepID=A0A6A5HPY3_CAERE|nr:hypothetical protein GCK72_000179 [Caenorhabditis remanei]KAF1768367.1 hypothetical protein GCK72_000179 [Caenorhabditis remanei]